MTDIKTIDDVVDNQLPANLRRRINQIRYYDRCIKNCLPQGLNQHCQAINYDSKHVLLIHVTNTSLITQLRFTAATLIQQLKKRYPCFNQLTTINFKVAPNLGTNKPVLRLKRQPISEKNIKIIQQVADNISSKKLRESLNRLISSTKQ